MRPRRIESVVYVNKNGVYLKRGLCIFFPKLSRGRVRLMMLLSLVRCLSVALGRNSLVIAAP